MLSLKKRRILEVNRSSPPTSPSTPRNSSKLPSSLKARASPFPSRRSLPTRSTLSTSPRLLPRTSSPLRS